MGAPGAQVLSAAERSAVEAMRARVHAEAPWAIEVIKAFHDAGLIEGWRSVIGINTPRGDGVVYSGPYTMHMNDSKRKEKS